MLDKTVKRPALRYYGGKWNLAPWIISFFPKHHSYIEPCGGAASVLLRKARSSVEVYNDIDQNVVMFFRMLRDRPADLIRAIQLTPWARAEYLLSHEPTADPLEQARRFFCLCWQGFNGSTAVNNLAAHGWRVHKGLSSRYAPNDTRDLGAWDLIADRLQGVQIEDQDWREVIARFDGRGALLYVDPPYLTKTRTKANWYGFEWKEKDHCDLADTLNNCAGFVVLSGYACDLYSELYGDRGWIRFDKGSQTNSGARRIESLWLSPRTVAALEVERGRAAQGDLGI